jgi:UDP-2,3-diacylglucosamine pyrophosphatase LpxH
VTTTFDEVYSVSDLHLGGARGFQIFDQGELLGATIRALAARPPERDVALVLNGDVVDFLAEPGATYLDVQGATPKLARIAADPAFSPVFEALGAFVHTPRRTLVIAMGNHDVELALPESRAFLEDHLCGSDMAARGRLRFVMDGTGFATQVGGTRALFVHGNEVDVWNVVDHEALRKVVRALNAGAPLPAWEANAGTQMVIDVMNSIKRSHPLVDLLKPETRPVPAVLAALDPRLLKKLAKLAPVLVGLTRTSVKRKLGLLGGGTAQEGDLVPLSEDQALRQLMPHAVRSESGEELLARAEKSLARGESPLDWSTLPGTDQHTLGIGGMAVDLMLGRNPDENLRDALLGWLASDKTFDWGAEDGTFLALDQAVGPEVDFVVAGHTHLERSLRRKHGRGRYFNSGTWVRLIQLDAEQLRDGASFKPVVAAFRKGSITALEQANLVKRTPTVVALRVTPDGTRGELLHAAPAPEGVKLIPIAGSEHLARG